MARPVSAFPAIAVTSINGVSVGVHTLTKQAERLESICNRVGIRLSWWLRTTMQSKEMPSAEFLEAFRYYQAALLGLLKEQRERARLADGGAARSEAELEAQFKAELRKALSSFTPEERAFAMKLWGQESRVLVPTKTEEKP
jgi:hypothetical protein